MERYENLLWTAFENTGKISNYLKYKTYAENTKVEVGEEFGLDKNIGNSDKNHKIR